MQRKGVLSISVLLLGIVMLAVAGMAPAASSARKGGTLRIDSPEDVDYIDPGLAYGTTSWEIEYVTALKLLDYPDAGVPRGTRLVPSGASHYTVSKDGKTYTFFVRNGYRFSNGERVTAKSYAYAINRNLDRGLQSPAFQFVSDPQATNIVGAAAVRAGTARNASGVVAKGNRLIVKLTKADPTFLAKITMPFFQATSTKLVRGKEVVNVNDRNDLPTAGRTTSRRATRTGRSSSSGTPSTGGLDRTPPRRSRSRSGSTSRPRTARCWPVTPTTASRCRRRSMRSSRSGTASTRAGSR